MIFKYQINNGEFMKKIVISILALSSFSILAADLGLPSEDPIVKNLRDRFEQAKAPSEDEILGKSFRCKEISAKKGDFSKSTFPDDLTFSQFDGFFVVHQNNSKMNGHMLVNNGKELIGSTRTPQYMSFRIDDKQNLIAEWTSLKNERVLLDPITRGLSEDQKVVSYKICVSK